MRKYQLNGAIGEPEHAWLSVYSKREGISLIMAVRTLIKEHMRREIAQEAIALGLRCAWESCPNLPDMQGEWPHLCRPHGDAAEARLQEKRKAARAEGRKR